MASEPKHQGEQALSVLLDILYLLAVGLATPLLLYRRIRRGPGSLALAERLGRTPVRPVSAHCVWIHAVSLGEINAARTLIHELRTRSPDTIIAISATTATGLARARELYADHIVFRFPLDFSWVIRRVLDRLRPSAIVLMELEVWPNHIHLATRRGIPILIANGRVTEEKSMRRFRWPVLRSVARWMFAQVDWVGAQDQTYANRFRQLGVPGDRIEIVGSMKYDAAETADWIDGQTELAREMAIDHLAPLWVCGSTGPGEEALLLEAYRRLLEQVPDLQLAIIPRKPERFDEVAEQIVAAGFACLRRSGIPPVAPRGVDTPRPVFLGDTMGELRKFYALATAVFVGRSLVPLGGSDVMEVAGLARALVVGPYTENFEEPVDALRQDDACFVARTVDELVARTHTLLTDHHLREKMGERARATILSRRGASARTARRVLDRF